MSDVDKAADNCLTRVRNSSLETVVVLGGTNFGSLVAAFSVTMEARDGSGPVPCDPCFLDHTTARCVSPASKLIVYDLTVTVAGQSSNAAVYDYSEIVKMPTFVDVQPLVAPTSGGTILTISGSNFKDRGSVQLTKGDSVVVCATPPLGEQGDLGGVYYGRDGKTIKVCAKVLPVFTGRISNAAPCACA